MTSFADRFAQIAVSPNESNRGRKPGRPGRKTAPCHGRPYGSFSLFTLRSSLFTLYSLLFTLYSSLFTLYSLLFTLHSLLFTLYSSLPSYFQSLRISRAALWPGAPMTPPPG